MTGIFSAWPEYSDEEINAVVSVLKSGLVNAWTGEQCSLFEKEYAAWTRSNYAIALANGTVALELSLRALDIGPGDEVIVTPRTFIASVSSIINVGAKPVFAEIDRDSQNITAETVSSVCTKKTKAVICVHLAGWPIEMDEMKELASRCNLFLIEDCAQAHGAQYKGQSVGTFGDVSAWSFCQDKIITTGGEGGMVTTNRTDLFEFMRSYKDHGKSWDAIYDNSNGAGSFKWVHETFGTNWRMTEMQAAIGRLQLGKMSKWHTQRKHYAEIISASAKEIKLLRVPDVPDYIEHAWYKYYVFVRPEMIGPGWSRDRIIMEINSRGVPCFSGACPEVYLEKAFESIDTRPVARMPVAKELGETSIMFMVHPTLTENEIVRTVDILKEVCTQASK